MIDLQQQVHPKEHAPHHDNNDGTLHDVDMNDGESHLYTGKTDRNENIPWASKKSFSIRVKGVDARDCYLFCIVTLIAVAIVVCLVLLLPGGAGDIETALWPQNGNGLSITVINSLDSHWQDIFNEYIDLWDNGSPDSLTLTTIRRSYACAFIDHHINVCNSNVGDTDFLGVETTLYQRGTMLASVALLNEYYLMNASTFMRKYVMCHELGHAWGLPHSDTRFYNIDLGECMDYTANYHNNLAPGQANFEKLYFMYGSVEDEDDNDNYLRRRLGQEEEDGSDGAGVMKEFSEIIECLQTKKSCADCIAETSLEGASITVLLFNEHAEECQLDLGDGYGILTHKLLVPGAQPP